MTRHCSANGIRVIALFKEHHFKTRLRQGHFLQAGVYKRARVGTRFGGDHDRGFRTRPENLENLVGNFIHWYEEFVRNDFRGEMNRG